MEWLKKFKSGIEWGKKKETPDNLWVKCDTCKEILFRKQLERQMWVCPNCSHHFRVNADFYKDLVIDTDTFSETDADIGSVDTLGFKDKISYSDRIKKAEAKTGRKSAVITGTGTIFGREITAGFMNFAYMGGSMGSAVGEKISRAAELSMDTQKPFVLFCASGGARMQEGILSLMQMSKISAVLALLGKMGIPYVPVLTHPTTGGVTASFAMLGDVIVAEPKALIGFAGPRVIKETIRQELPEGFQRSEFCLEHGFIDVISDRRDLKETLGKILNHLCPENSKVRRVNESEDGASDVFVDEKGSLKKIRTEY